MSGLEETPKEIKNIKIEELELWEKANVRKSNTLQNIDDLVRNIKKIGIRVPLLVKEGNGKYLVFSGQRRLEAARLAGFKRLPCLVFKNITESEARIMSLSENIYRENMTPDDISDAAYHLMQELKSIKEISKMLGVPESRIKKYMGYRHVPEELKSLVRSHKMTAIQAVEIFSKFPEKERSIAIANEYSKITKQEKPRFFQSISLASPSDDIKTLHDRASKIKQDKMQVFKELVFPQKDSELIKKLASQKGMSSKELIIWIVHQWLIEYGQGARSLG